MNISEVMSLTITNYKILYVPDHIKLTTGRRVDGLAFADAKITGTCLAIVLLIAVVRRREQTRLLQDSPKVIFPLRISLIQASQEIRCGQRIVLSPLEGVLFHLHSILISGQHPILHRPERNLP